MFSVKWGLNCQSSYCAEKGGKSSFLVSRPRCLSVCRVSNSEKKKKIFKDVFINILPFDLAQMSSL